MIVVRNVFQVKFGMVRELRQLWSEWKKMAADLGAMRGYRTLTDLTGASYTFVLEIEFDNLASYESGQQALFNNPAWRTFYSKVTPLIESGHREIYSVEDVGTADSVVRAASGMVAEPV